MQLVKEKDTLTQDLNVNYIKIHEGSGAFLMDGGYGNKHKTIKIYYHKPKNYQADSRILLVIPGAGRNGDSYRDAWIEESEEYSILILSPMYPKEEYDYGGYHLGNLVYDLNLEDCVAYDENLNHVFLDEEKFSFKINPNKNEWIYKDFDRLFDKVVSTLGATQSNYDIFGHSAGGQILHRFAIFQSNNKVSSILASNSGSYTLPNFDKELPFGLKNSVLTKEDLKISFGNNLVLFIGELDNDKEQGGLLLRSRTVDKQGLHRLARAKHFYEQSKRMAEEMGFQFNWKLKIIPNIGHNHRKMGNAAGAYLYKN
ncbi:MAG: hypothetical protein COA50_00845 [Flavobacteriaceae bacterium]|nr:MAG: hypothetical protein COA50_00845 [Flavobacteriaceae bacterium]